MAYAASGTVTGTANTVVTGIAANFSSSGPLAQYSGLDINALPYSGAVGAATTPFFASDGIIGWGRWTGTTSGTGAAGPNPLTGVFDYIVGIPTAAMPVSGTATYSLMGYTSPTATNGSTGYTVNGTINATFGANPIVGINMTVANSAANTFTVNGPLTVVAGTAIFNSGINATGTGCPSSSCTTTINGFFAGTNASRAGLSYSINTLSAIGNIQGVAAFTKN
jgi:hypothetical protein